MDQVTVETMNNAWQDLLRSPHMVNWMNDMVAIWKKKISENRPSLCMEIDPETNLFSHLESQEIFIRRLCLSCAAENGRYNQVAAILNALIRRPFGDFVKFCKILTLLNQKHIVLYYLNCNDIPRKVENERVGSTETDGSHSPEPSLVVVPGWTKLITNHYPELSEQIDPDSGLFNILVAKKIIPLYRLDTFVNVVGKSKRVCAILDHLLLKRPDEDFLKFCEALKENNQGDIVSKYLNPNLPCPERVTSTPADTSDFSFGVNPGLYTHDWQKLLITKRIELVEQIESVPDILNWLQREEIINIQGSEICRELRDEYQQKEYILDHMRRRSTEEFHKFCKILKECNQTHIVEQYLTPEVREESTQVEEGRYRQQNSEEEEGRLEKDLHPEEETGRFYAQPTDDKSAVQCQDKFAICDMPTHNGFMNQMSPFMEWTEDSSKSSLYTEASDRPACESHFQNQKQDQYSSGIQPPDLAESDLDEKCGSIISQPCDDLDPVPVLCTSGQFMHTLSRTPEPDLISEPLMQMMHDIAHEGTVDIAEHTTGEPYHRADGSGDIVQDGGRSPRITFLSQGGAPVDTGYFSCARFQQYSPPVQHPQPQFLTQHAAAVVEQAKQQPCGAQQAEGRDQVVAGAQRSGGLIETIADEVQWNSDGPTRLTVEQVKVRPCSQTFYEEHREKGYAMSKNPRGLCLIFSMFKVENNPDRDGTNVDCSLLHALFTQLHFTVQEMKDYTAQEIKDFLLTTAADQELLNHQCVAIFVLSHGATVKQNGRLVQCIYGRDGKPVFVEEDVLNVFTTERCPLLANKPKMVFFQACRGQHYDETDGVSTIPDHVGETVTDSNKPPSYKDFIVLYPTQSHYKSFRNTALGSWYVNAIVRVFMERAHDTGLCTMMNSVNSVVSRWQSNTRNSESNKKTQIAQFTSNFTKDDLFFFPEIVL